MKKRALIDLTPLLDVIMLLLFAFIIVMQGTSDEQAERVEAETNLRIEAEERVVELSEQNAQLEEEVYELTNSNTEYQEEIARLEGLLDTQTVANDAEKQSLDAALAAFREMTKLSDTDLRDILDSQPNPAMALSEMLDADDMVLELYKYSYVMSRFYFLDIELTGANNRVLINGEDTHIVIDSDDNANTTTRHDKAIVIYDELQKHISTRSGGDEMVMAILIVRDAEVYQFAYEIVMEALRELELRASGYRFYKTSYTYLE